MKFRDLQYLIESMRFSKFHRLLIFSKFLNNKLLNIRLKIRYFKNVYYCRIVFKSHIDAVDFKYTITKSIINRGI